MIYHLLLGSNLDDPPGQIGDAISRISSISGILVCRSSSQKVSKAYGKTDQPDFFNQILEVQSDLSPAQLLECMLQIETDMGRIRKEKWGARSIDIDILLAESTVTDTDNLKIPHHDLHNRAFALSLLCELVPQVKHPTLNKTMRELLEGLPGGNT